MAEVFARPLTGSLLYGNAHIKDVEIIHVLNLFAETLAGLCEAIEGFEANLYNIECRQSVTTTKLRTVLYGDWVAQGVVSPQSLVLCVDI